MAYQPPVYIDTLDKLTEALDYWKNTTFSPHYLKLDDVVKSLGQPGANHLVEARQEYAARWILCPPGGRKPATMWTAGVWRWNSDLETGNFVPPGETAPARLPESRIQTTPNNMCRFTYVFDTTFDRSLWAAQQAFEDYITAVKKFNPGKKVRREFQNGLSHTHTFHLSSQVFVKRTAYTRAKEANRTYPLHEWIRDATKKGMPFFANDEKPTLFEPDEQGGLRPLSEGYPSTLKVGDLVWMSLTPEFFIGTTAWSTNFIPYEFVRVGNVALELLPDIKREFEEGDEEEGPRAGLGVGMRGIPAAEARQLNERGNQPAPVHAQEPAPPAMQPIADLAVIDDVAFAPTVVPNASPMVDNSFVENARVPRSPRAFIDSESEEQTTGDEVDSATQLDDDESMMQEYLSLDDFLDDDDSSLTDVGAEPTDDALSTIDDTASLADDNDEVFVTERSASEVDVSASILPALPSSSNSMGKSPHQRDAASSPEVVQQAISAKPSRKRPASSERVLRKRIAKGKGVAK